MGDTTYLVNGPLNESKTFPLRCTLVHLMYTPVTITLDLSIVWSKTAIYKLNVIVELLALRNYVWEAIGSNVSLRALL